MVVKKAGRRNFQIAKQRKGKGLPDMCFPSSCVTFFLHGETSLILG